ncbi:MAG: hypothetical protein ACXW14_03620, partial [Burkholderiaceae bacterium]
MIVQAGVVRASLGSAHVAHRLATTLLVAAGALLGSSAAEESRARTDVQWIQAVRQAAQRVNYQGTVVYQAGGEMR